MVDILLTAEPFLGGFRQDFQGVTLEEITDISLISIAQPLRGRAALQKAVLKTWGCTLPAPGGSVRSKDNKARLLCLGPDSFLMMLTDGNPVKDVTEILGRADYCTDQSDNWVALRIAGPLFRAVLARICPINLHADIFPPGAFARTSMQHLGTIIVREGPGEFLQLSASSSAGSFLQALTTSIKNVAEPAWRHFVLLAHRAREQALSPKPCDHPARLIRISIASTVSSVQGTVANSFAT